MTPQDPTEISIDTELCAASAMCQSIAPGLFSMPDDGDWAVVLKPMIDDPSELELAEEAAGACPTLAILLRQRDRAAD